MPNQKIHTGTIETFLLIANLIAGILYLGWWLIPTHVGNPILYYLLFIGEIYHLFMAYTFWLTIWPATATSTPPLTLNHWPSVDVFIPVVGEPIELVRLTVLAAKNLDYPRLKIYLLNDGLVAHVSHWQAVEQLARELDVFCITREIPGGAKAGNLNHALKNTTGDLVAIFDSDMAPHSNFLKKTVPYFSDPQMGFVQTPQYYQNHRLNQVTQGAWGQQDFFFGPILQGKAKHNAVFLCGTNVVMRRTTLMDVGGFYEQSIAEDFLTSLLIHQQGWLSHYVPEVLAEGLAPEDLLSYYKQQYRWARGSLTVVFRENPLFKSGLTTLQKLQYLSSAMYYLNGPVILIDMLMPLFFLYFNLQAVVTTTTSFAIFFIPFMFLNLLTLYLSSAQSLTLKALSFTYSSWYLQFSALRSLLLQEKVTFAVTPKQALTGNYLFLAYPHLIYITLATAGWIIGLTREGLSPAVVTNISWTIFNTVLFIPFINSSYLPTSSPVSVKAPPSSMVPAELPVTV